MFSILSIMKQSPVITMDVVGGSVLFLAILVLTILSFQHHENSQTFLSAAHVLAIAYVGVMIAVGSAVMAASK